MSIAFAPKSETAEPALPATFSIANAKLPANYETAKAALENCASIDECVDWADKAAALASYAKQADDHALLTYATRVRARAVRRSGELLALLDGRGKSVGGPTSSRKDAGKQAGMSKHQQVQAVRVASVPQDQFVKQVEKAAQPATVTTLAEQGKRAAAAPKKGKPDWMPATRPEGFQAATELFGSVKRFAEFCTKHDAAIVAAAVMESEVADLRRHVATIDGWLDRFIVNLKG